MKVLASLKPYYYYLIGEKIKTLEIRKSDLKNLPQDVLFYMSKDEKSFEKIPKEFQEKYRKHFGKVGIEFTCDKSICLDYYPQDYTGMPGKFSEMICKESCLSYNEIMAYKKEKLAYGWQISNLKVYGEPKKLSEFYRPCSYKGICYSCNRFRPNGTPNDKPNDFCDGAITRPPQSYMFVKEVEQ
jgi:hypothetical protein